MLSLQTRHQLGSLGTSYFVDQIKPVLLQYCINAVLMVLCQAGIIKLLILAVLQKPLIIRVQISSAHLFQLFDYFLQTKLHLNKRSTKHFAAYPVICTVPLGMTNIDWYNLVLPITRVKGHGAAIMWY
jgi:hypothetical protein